MSGNNSEPKTVLIIEDSVTQALQVKAVLEAEQLQVIMAHDGRAGLEMARAQLPDLILLDLQMPEMHGLQVCKALKAFRETFDIPVILLTSHDDEEIVVLGMQVGAIDFIPKDAFAEAVLLETLRQMAFI